MGWLNDLWQRWLDWLEGWKPCHKESIGYTCRHQTYADGSKECGMYPNYWEGDRE